MVKIIEPKNGGWFTQINLKEDEQRIFSKKLINPKDEDWIEWSNEEKIEFEFIEENKLNESDSDEENLIKNNYF